MITATETREILHRVMEARVDSGKKKAYDALDAISQCIKIAATNGLTNTVVFILRITTFDNDNEKLAYISTIREELKANGYHTLFTTESGALKITWGY